MKLKKGIFLNINKNQCRFVFFIVSFFATGVKATEVKALVQANIVNADSQASWFEADTGILAYSKDSLNLQQAVLNIKDTIISGLSYDIVANYYQLGQQHLGFSQAQLLYKPLSNSAVRWRARFGLFYPNFSFENVDMGWLSPYTYTQSAINSWIGEELRIAGLELTAYSPGRARNSPFSWEFHSAVYKANDPLGAIITWRGFALHDRQSLNNEQITIAAYPTVVEPDRLNHPDYVEPFHEFDGRFGFYLGSQLNYYRQTSVRYYYFDNQADPNKVNNQRLYGWHTHFQSLAVQHDFNVNTRLIGQWLSGNTVMGNKFVDADFKAWYLLLSHNTGPHRISLRYDNFKVIEDDVFPWDKNDSDGEALTLAWRYTINSVWQIGIEQHLNSSHVASRESLGQEIDLHQQQTLAVLQYRWDS
jgi:hypothetical protein